MLRYRLISGLSLTTALAIVVFWRSPLSALLFLLLGCVFLSGGLRELFGMTAALGAPGYPRWTRTVAVLLVLSTGLLPAAGLEGRCPALLGDALALWLLLVGAFYLTAREASFAQGLRNLAASLGAYLYLAWSLSFLAKIYFIEGFARGEGPLWVFFLILSTKLGDVGGYAFGKLTARRPGGNHKMIPRISPGKSWEGFAGTLLFCVGGACLMVALFGPRFAFPGGQSLGYGKAILVGVILGALGLLGDLSESLIKRASGIKDSGSILPGLGGMLDALDSLILVAPLFYFFFILHA